MFTPQQYRAKAAEYAVLVKTASNTDEAREFRKLEISFAALAAHSQWMADNQNKTVHAPVTTQEKEPRNARIFHCREPNFRMSAIGTKRTSRSYVRMSAFDPKRTSSPNPPTMTSVIATTQGENQTRK
jgi:hypothetical protein